MTSRRPKRVAGFSYTGGYRYFVTYCAHNRRQLFLSADVVDPLTSQLLHSCRAYEFAVFAYVFMPDHLHFLVEGLSEAADFRTFMRVARQRMSVAFRSVATDRSVGPLWQDGYYEHVLRKEEATVTVAAYIIANPVRAGLVEDARQYPFSWCVDWADHNSVRPT